MSATYHRSLQVMSLENTNNPFCRLISFPNKTGINYCNVSIADSRITTTVIFVEMKLWDLKEKLSELSYYVNIL